MVSGRNAHLGDLDNVVHDDSIHACSLLAVVHVEVIVFVSPTENEEPVVVAIANNLF